MNMTFRNTAGPAAHQAVALRVDSDRSAFFRVAVEGHQDTLYAHSLRQLYRDCRIAGTVDFVFGNGIVVVQRSLVATLPLAPGQTGSVTAQGREDPNGLLLPRLRGGGQVPDVSGPPVEALLAGRRDGVLPGP